MAYTAGALATKVQTRVRDTGYSTSTIKEFLTDTVRDIHNEHPSLPIWKATATFTLTATNSDITAGVGLPANYGSPIQLINTTNGSENVIPYIDESDLEYMYPDHSDSTRHADGQPQYWYFDGSTIRLFPAPNAAYTLRLQYMKEAGELSADGDVPTVPYEFEELLVVGAAYRVLQVKGVYDEAGILENKYVELLQKLVNKSLRTPTPHIMKTNRIGGAMSRSIDSLRRIPY